MPASEKGSENRTFHVPRRVPGRLVRHGFAWCPTRFALVRHHVVEFSRVALQRFDRDKTDHLLDRVVSKDNVGVLTLLEKWVGDEELLKRMESQLHRHADAVIAALPRPSQASDKLFPRPI